VAGPRYPFLVLSWFHSCPNAQRPSSSAKHQLRHKEVACNCNYAFLQAKGLALLAVQVDVDDNTERQRIRDLLTSDLDVTQARVLQLGGLQVPPQQGVLWLEQHTVTREWADLSPGLVVLAAGRAQVGTRTVPI
jgi:hypothetical protein